MQYIYDTLDPDIADNLRENNPNPGGKKHHHQLFNDFAYTTLQQHIIAVLGIMKASINLEKFKENIVIAFPNARTRRVVRINTQKKIDFEAKKQTTQTPLQFGLFDYIETVNTPAKENKQIVTIKNDDVEQSDDFNSKLKKALNYNPK